MNVCGRYCFVPPSRHSPHRRLDMFSSHQWVVNGSAQRYSPGLCNLQGRWTHGPKGAGKGAKSREAGVTAELYLPNSYVEF